MCVRKAVLAMMLVLIGMAPFQAYAVVQSNAEYAVVMDGQTGEVLFSKKGDEQMVPSSMTKLMTLYLFFEYLQKGVVRLDDTFHVSEKAWRMGGSKMFVRVDTQVKVSDLLRGIAVQSGNDACIVVAERIGGSEESFAELMNAKAKELGMTNSHFKNSTGWPDEGHYMSAIDIARLSHALMRDFPEYYHYFAEKSFTYNGITQSNRNLLLGRHGINVDGLKTGHTEAAGYGLAASAKEDGRRMIAVVNGLKSAKGRANEAARLLTYGFRNFAREKVLASGQRIAKAKIWQGEAPMVELMVNQDITLTLPKLDKENVTFEVMYDAPIAAPIGQGVQVGMLKINVPGQEGAHEYPLYTAQEVKRLGFLGRLMQNLGGHADQAMGGMHTVQ